MILHEKISRKDKLEDKQNKIFVFSSLAFVKVKFENLSSVLDFS